MELKNRSLIVTAIAAAFVGLTAGFGVADTRTSPASSEPALSQADPFVYYPSLYTLNAPDQVSEHIQAF